MATVDVCEIRIDLSLGSDAFHHTYLFGWSVWWSCSEAILRKIVVALTSDFASRKVLGPWTRSLGDPVDSSLNNDATDAHKSKPRSETTSEQGAGPICSGDLEKSPTRTCSASRWRHGIQRYCFSYVAQVAGKNLCVNELSRLRYVSLSCSIWLQATVFGGVARAYVALVSDTPLSQMSDNTSRGSFSVIDLLFVIFLTINRGYRDGCLSVPDIHCRNEARKGRHGALQRSLLARYLGWRQAVPFLSSLNSAPHSPTSKAALIPS